MPLEKGFTKFSVSCRISHNREYKQYLISYNNLIFTLRTCNTQQLLRQLSGDCLSPSEGMVQVLRLRHCLYRTCPLYCTNRVLVYLVLILGWGEGRTKLVPSDFLNRQHPLLELPRGLMALCRRTLGGERHRYATAWPDKFGTDPMAVGGIYRRLHRHGRGKREEGKEPVTKHQIQPECGE